MPLHGEGMDCGGDMGLDFGLGGEGKLGAQRQIQGGGGASWSLEMAVVSVTAKAGSPSPLT